MSADVITDEMVEVVARAIHADEVARGYAAHEWGDFPATDEVYRHNARAALGAREDVVTARLVEERRRVWNDCVREARSMGEVTNTSWFLDALAARNPYRRRRGVNR